MTTSNSSSTAQGEDGAISAGALVLGKLLAAQLDDTDTLGRWMAHHVAALIVRAESESGRTDLPLQHQTRDTILSLWNHRAGLPASSRPLESFDPIYRALARLDPERPAWERLRGARQRDWEDDALTGPYLWAAIAVEEGSMRAIRSLLQEASRIASDEERVWIEAAAEAGAEDTELIDLFDGLDLLMQGLAADETPRPNLRNNSSTATLRAIDESIAALQEARDALTGRE